MRRYAFIAAGGFLGAVLRFFVRGYAVPSWNGSIPIPTLLVNITGCVLLGFFLAIAEDILNLKEEERAGIAVGFLGAFTTFSTISKELSLQLMNREYAAAALYIILSLLLGLLGVLIGTKTGSRLALAISESREKE